MKQTQVTSRKPVAMVVCGQVTSVTDIDLEGYFTTVKCGCMMLMSHARAVGWMCPKCKLAEKEMWCPTSVESIQRAKERSMLTETIEEATI